MTTISSIYNERSHKIWSRYSTYVKFKSSRALQTRVVDTDVVYYDAAFCVFQQRLYFSHEVKGENVLNAWISFTFGILFIYVFWIFCNSVKSDRQLFVLLISDVAANDNKPICLWADRLWHSLSKQHNTLAGFPAPWFLWAFWSFASD